MSILRLTVKDIRDRLAVIRERQNALSDSVRLIANTRAQLGPDMARLRQVIDHGSEVTVRGHTLMERAQKTADVSHHASQVICSNIPLFHTLVAFHVMRYEFCITFLKQIRYFHIFSYFIIFKFDFEFGLTLQLVLALCVL